MSDSVFRTKIEKTINSVCKTYEIASAYGNDDLKNMQLYCKIVEKVCNLEEEFSRSHKALEKAKNADTMEEFDQIYEMEMAQFKSCNGKKSSRYSDFISRIQMASQHGTNNEDDDIEMEGELSEFDPFTKLPLQNPVKNKICRHIYEKSSIEESLKMNSNIRCPISGCPNKKFIILADLSVDEAMKRRIEDKRNDI